MPNNGNNGTDYDVFFSSGSLTQDIVDGVVINQLFMSGGVLVLANPLTLEVGLQFSGGSITSGILNVAGLSNQSALMTVSGTIINNSGIYDLTLTSGNLFSGSGSIFNNSGTVARSSGTGTVTFNIPLNNTGTFAVNSGTLILTSGNVVINNGTLRAGFGGVLILSGSGGGTLSNVESTIEALDGSEVQLTSDISIVGGVLATTGSGVIRGNSSQNVFLTDLANTGTFIADNNSDLGLAGTITNSGTIIVNSTGSATDLEVQTGGLTLDGGGTVIFSGGPFAGINSITTGTRLTNVDNLIQGQGRLGQDNTAFTNGANGIIDANVDGLTLTLDPVTENSVVDEGASFLNDGTLRASDGGVLVLSGNGGGSFTNNGTIEALDGSQVQLTNGVSVTGGTLITAGTGVIRANSSQDVFLTDLSNTGTLLADNNSDLGLAGTITNSGSITVTSSGSATDIEIQDGGVTLDGGGTVTFAGGQFAGLNSAVTGTRLTNIDNLIQGQGRIGQNNTAITNQAGGIISANVNGASLTLDPATELNVVDDGPSFLNNGILRASNGGVLILTGNAGGSFTNNNLIEALDGSEVQLTNEASVTGGILSTTGTGIIRANSSQNVFLTNLTISGTLLADNNCDLGLAGTITNTGSITVTSIGSATDIEVQAGGATLTGAGTVTLAGGPFAGINSIETGARLTNVNNLIQGQGRIGQNTTSFTNQARGIINANVSGATLTLDPAAEAVDGGASFLNNGILRASNASVLILTGNGGGGFTNNNLIEALDGSEVQLTNGASITGGILSTTGTGIIRANSSQDVFLTGLTLSGTLLADNNCDLGLAGIITNNGSITVTSSGSATDIEVQAGGATLTGGGTVTLAGGDFAGINSAITGTRLTITNNLIQGRGRIGQNNTAFTLAAGNVINANIAATTLTLDPVTEASVIDLGASFLNNGTLRASNGATLLLTGNGGGSFTNNGLIEALTGSEVQLTSGVSIVGGTLSTTGTGIVRANSSQDVFLTTLTNSGTLLADNNSDLGLAGTITNSGSITITSTGSATDIEIQSDGVTLTGGGTVTLAGGDFAGINSALTGTRLTNVNNLIQGRGRIGQNNTALTNQLGGIIDANIDGATLTIDPVTEGSVGDLGPSFLNNGTLQATDGGILVLSGNGGGAFTNSGTIKATTGGALQVTATVTSSGTVDVGSDTLSVTGGGTYTQSAGTFRLAGGTVTSSTALVFNGGLIDARGTINSAITNGANLQPALGGTGLNVTGAVSLLSSSKLTFQLGGLTQGNQYGFLNINGTVALNGNLVVSFVNSFQAANKDNFTVLSSTALSGVFANVASGTRLATSDGTGTFLVTYNGNTVVLSDFQSDIPAAPSSGTDKSTAAVVRSRFVPRSSRQKNLEGETWNESQKAPSATVSAGQDSHQSSTVPSANEPKVSPSIRLSNGKTATAKGKGRSIAINLKNTDQLLALLEGSAATTAHGKVIVNPKSVAKTPQPDGGNTPNNAGNLPGQKRTPTEVHNRSIAARTAN